MTTRFPGRPATGLRMKRRAIQSYQIQLIIHTRPLWPVFDKIWHRDATLISARRLRNGHSVGPVYVTLMINGFFCYHVPYLSRYIPVIFDIDIGSRFPCCFSDIVIDLCISVSYFVNFKENADKQRVYKQIYVNWRALKFLYRPSRWLRRYAPVSWSELTWAHIHKYCMRIMQTVSSLSPNADI